MSTFNKIVTFSYKEGDTKDDNNIKYLKDRADLTGISFSFMVLEVIQQYIKNELRPNESKSKSSDNSRA